MTRDYVAAFPVTDTDRRVSELVDEAEDALDGLLEDDDCTRVGPIAWDVHESHGALYIVVKAPVIYLGQETAA